MKIPSLAAMEAPLRAAINLHQGEADREMEAETERKSGQKLQKKNKKKKFPIFAQQMETSYTLTTHHRIEERKSRHGQSNQKKISNELNGKITQTASTASEHFFSGLLSVFLNMLH